MAKAAKTKKAKPSTQLRLDDARWRPVSKIVEQLLPHVGGAVLTAHDLTKALANEKMRCMRRFIRTGHVDVDKLCDIELELKILGGEPSAAEHFPELFEPFARVRASNRRVTPKLIIAALGLDAGTILVNDITTLGQYVERLAAEANLPLTPGHREWVPALFWAKHCLACSPKGDIGAGFLFPPNDHGPSEPSSTLTANWAFYLWEPDCLKEWPALAPQAIAAGEADASRSLSRKRGPPPHKDWKLFIAYKLYMLKKAGERTPTARELADYCQKELGYVPDESAISLWLRELGR
jgi:hypothetical protein